MSGAPQPPAPSVVRFPDHPERRPAVVSGASSGIGRATARALAGARHPVVLGARRVERCEEVAAEIRSQGGDAVAVHLDLTDPGSTEAFVKAAQDAFGDVEILVSNAGDVAPAMALDIDPQRFATTLEVNLLGAHRLVALLAPGMVRRGRGDLVFVTSDAVRGPRPGASAYVASKWGLEGYARTLQMELEGTGVRASIVQPGQTLTGMGNDWDPGTTTEVLESWIRWGIARHPNLLRPESVAAAVLTSVSTPRGVHLTMIEVRPEAPVTGGEP